MGMKDIEGLEADTNKKLAIQARTELSALSRQLSAFVSIMVGPPERASPPSDLFRRLKASYGKGSTPS